MHLYGRISALHDIPGERCQQWLFIDRNGRRSPHFGQVMVVTDGSRTCSDSITMGPTWRDAMPGLASVALAICDTGDGMPATFHIVKQLISVDCLCENHHGELITASACLLINRRSAVALEYRRTIDAPDVVRLWVDRIAINGSERRVTIGATARHCTRDRTAAVRPIYVNKTNRSTGSAGDHRVASTRSSAASRNCPFSPIVSLSPTSRSTSSVSKIPHDGASSPIS